MQSVTIPIRTESESNKHEHWRKRQKRAKEQRGITATVCRAKLGKPKWLPIVVRLVRIAPRKLDQGNHVGALKHIQDGVADWLGIDDRRDDLVKYSWDQEKGDYAVRIEVSS